MAPNHDNIIFDNKDIRWILTDYVTVAIFISGHYYDSNEPVSIETFSVCMTWQSMDFSNVSHGNENVSDSFKR